MKKLLVASICVLVFVSAATVNAQSTTSTETENGVTYQVTRQVVPRSVPVTEFQSREQKVYRPQVTTQYQTYQQTYLVPVTEYQYVPRLRGQWNPFIQPYWVHELRPTTRWEARPGSVQVPVARTDWIEETRTMQVPVTTYRTVTDEITRKTFVGMAPNATETSVASRPIGGQKMTQDPPAQAPYRRQY